LGRGVIKKTENGNAEKLRIETSDGLLVNGEEHRRQNNLNKLKIDKRVAFFMPETIRLRAAQLRRDELKD
jgi:hypothetical protein